MKKFRQILAIMMCLLLTVIVCASCGEDSDGESKPDTSSVAQADGASADGASKINTTSKVSEPVKAEDMAVRPKSANKQVKNLKILPVGDSITFGIGSLSGWRYSAYKQLYAAGITFEFVGPYTSRWDYRMPERYRKHGSESGRTIQNVYDRADEIFNREFDVVMLMIGYNDKVTLASKHDLYKSLLNKIYSYNPKATVFCMGVAPDYGGGLEFIDFNKFVKETCEQMHGAGKEIYYISTSPALLDNSTCYTDFVHFNEKGNELIAECIVKGSVDILRKLNTADSSYTLPKNVTSLSLDKDKLELTKYTGHGESAWLKATVAPTDAEVTDVIWATSDKRVATVNSEGIVTAVKEGTCYITAASLDGGYSKVCTVTVKSDKTPSTNLFSGTFNSSADWEGPINRITLDRYGHPSVENTSKNTLNTKKTFDAGNKFIMSFDVQVFEILTIIQNQIPDNYVSLTYGDLELRVNDHERSVDVLCNGAKVCSYQCKSYSTDLLKFGMLYDNGKVTLLYQNAPVATGTANHTPGSFPLSIVNNELTRGLNVDNVNLIKY